MLAGWFVFLVDVSAQIDWRLFSLNTEQKLYRLNSRFCFDASKMDMLKAMVVTWESPIETQLLDPGDPHTFCKNHRLRMHPITGENTPLYASASLAFMPLGSTLQNVG